MKSPKSFVALALVSLSLLVAQRGHVQTAYAQNKDAAKKETADGEKKATKRLPNNYGQIGLSDEQKTKVRDVLTKYEAEIDKLEKQLTALKDKQDGECEAILTAEQKTRLTELNDAAKAKKAKKKKPADE